MRLTHSASPQTTPPRASPWPPQKFGRAVDHEVRAKGQRILIDGSGKRIVGDDDGAGAVPGRGNSGDVHDLKRRIGGRFQVDHLAARGDGGLDLFVIRRIAQIHVDIETGQKLQEQLVRSAI